MNVTSDRQTDQLCSSSEAVAKKLQGEGQIRRKTDQDGTRWFKVYFGGGAHYRNWLAQAEEIFGPENIQIEEVQFPDLKCFTEAAEKTYRIWVKEKQS